MPEVHLRCSMKNGAFRGSVLLVSYVDEIAVDELVVGCHVDESMTGEVEKNDFCLTRFFAF